MRTIWNFQLTEIAGGSMTGHIKNKMWVKFLLLSYMYMMYVHMYVNVYV